MRPEIFLIDFRSLYRQLWSDLLMFIPEVIYLSSARGKDRPSWKLEGEGKKKVKTEFVNIPGKWCNVRVADHIMTHSNNDPCLQRIVELHSACLTHGSNLIGFNG